MHWGDIISTLGVFHNNSDIPPCTAHTSLRTFESIAKEHIICADKLALAPNFIIHWQLFVLYRAVWMPSSVSVTGGLNNFSDIFISKRSQMEKHLSRESVMVGFTSYRVSNNDLICTTFCVRNAFDCHIVSFTGLSKGILSAPTCGA